MPKILEVPPDALKKVVQLLQTTEEELNKNVEKLKEWMKLQPHLPEIMDDARLQNFIILNKGKIETTKAKIDMYYTMRSKWSAIFENINPKLAHMQRLEDTHYLLPLPHLSKEMYRVVIFKARDKKLISEVNIWDTLRYGINGQEIRIREDLCYGDLFILDCTDLPIRFLMKVTPYWLYTTLQIYQSVFSMRLKGAYVVNAPSFMQTLLAIAKKLVKPKIFSRVYFHQDYEFLNRLLDKEAIPKDFGGGGPWLDEVQEMSRLKMIEHGDVFDKMDTLRVNERLRPKKENTGLVRRYFRNRN